MGGFEFFSTFTITSFLFSLLSTEFFFPLHFKIKNSKFLVLKLHMIQLITKGNCRQELHGTSTEKLREKNYMHNLI